MAKNLSVNIGSLLLKNPVMVASGTFGYGEEFRDFINLKRLGAIVTKTITINPRSGNPMPRTCETPAGMLNSIGLENPGIDIFIKEKLPFLKKIGVPVIASIASEGDTAEFVELARRLNARNEVKAIELNISCPNIRKGSHAPSRTLVAQDAAATYEVVKAVRRITRKTLITKLSPNVTDISAIAQAAQDAGSDAVALINTLMGMSIDVEARRQKIAMGVAGLSGPAIRPVAVRMVWEVYRRVKIPIIGMGGITDTASALEFLLAGATAVSVGTAHFVNPRAGVEIIDGINHYMAKYHMHMMREITGCVQSSKG